jgi:hypothetical protein
MEWVGSTLTLPRNTVYPALLPLMRTPRLPVVDRTDAPADLNGFVLFAERPNLVSARVPSHFKRSLPKSSVLSSGKRSQQKQLSVDTAVRDRNSSALPLGKMIQEKQVRTALFWVIARRVVVISYRRFGTRVKNPCWDS